MYRQDMLHVKIVVCLQYNYITKNRRKNQDSSNNVNVRNIINTQCHIIIHNTACAWVPNVEKYTTPKKIGTPIFKKKEKILN